MNEEQTPQEQSLQKQIPHVEYMGEKYPIHEVEVNPTNKFTFVIPVYREFEEGNIAELVENLLEQSTPTNEWECIFLVNNKKDKEDSSRANGKDDNQKTLAFLSAIQSGKGVENNFSTSETEIVTKARQKGMKVNIVDMSTNGISQVNIGAIRNTGLEIAKRRSEKTQVKGNGIIINFDADTRMSPNHVAKVLQEFENPQTKAVVTGMEWYPENLENPDLLENMQRASLNTQYYTLLKLIGSSEPNWGSPRVSFRLSALQELGGIPQLEEREDFVLTKKLIDKHHGDEISFIPEITVKTKFRLRPDNPDGFDSKEISKKFNLNTEFDPLKHSYQTFWDNWFYGKLIEFEEEGVSESDLGSKMSTFIQNFVDEDADNSALDELKRLTSRQDIVNWLYDYTNNGESPFSPIAGPNMVWNSIGFILHKEITEEEYGHLTYIIEKYIDDETILIEREKERYNGDGYLDVAKDIETTTFRASQRILSGVNIFLEEAISTNNLPETKRVIKLLSHSFK